MRKIDPNNIGLSIKVFLKEQKMTYVRLHELLNKKYGYKATVGNLSQRVRMETLPIKEFIQIADVMDCDVVIEPRKKNLI